MKVMGAVIFDTLRKWDGVHVGLEMFWDSFQQVGRPLLVRDPTILLSKSAIMWAACTQLPQKQAWQAPS